MKKFTSIFLSAILGLSTGFAMAANFDPASDDINNVSKVEAFLMNRGKSYLQLSDMTFDQKKEAAASLFGDMKAVEQFTNDDTAETVSVNLIGTPEASTVEQVAETKSASMFGTKSKVTVGTVAVALLAAFAVNGLTPEGKELAQSVGKSLSGMGSAFSGWAASFRK